MTSEQIIEWARTHHAMIHFWHKIVVYLPDYRHTTGHEPRPEGTGLAVGVSSARLLQV